MDRRFFSFLLLFEPFDRGRAGKLRCTPHLAASFDGSRRVIGKSYAWVLIGASLLLTLLLEPAADGEKRKGVALFCLGAAVAALSLIKINVGVFFGLPLLVVFLRQSWSTILASYLAPLAAIGLVLLPLAVQAILFDLPWVRPTARLRPQHCGGMSRLFSDARSPFVSAWAWIAILAGGGLTSLLIVGAMMAAGSSLHGILNGVLLQNMYFARNWYIPLHVGGRGLLAASLSLVAAGAYCLVITQPTRPAPPRPRRRSTEVPVRGGWTMVSFCATTAWTYSASGYSFCWLLLAPPETAANPYRIARVSATAPHRRDHVAKRVSSRRERGTNAESFPARHPCRFWRMTWRRPCVRSGPTGTLPCGLGSPLGRAP